MISPRISAGFWTLVLLVGWYDCGLAASFLAAIAVHEAGHMIALRLFGIPMYGFHLKLKGAQIETGTMSLLQELLCALAGPVFSGLFGILLLRIWATGSFVSLGLGILNFLPLYPLDGGRIAYAGLLMIAEERTVERVMRFLSFVVAGGLMVGTCWCAVWLQAGIWPIFAALVLLWRTGQVEK